MLSHVYLQVLFFGKTFGADLTAVPFFPRVLPQVSGEDLLLGVIFAADFTNERPLTGVLSHVHIVIPSFDKIFVANFTGEWSLDCMLFLMLVKVSLL